MVSFLSFCIHVKIFSMHLFLFVGNVTLGFWIILGSCFSLEMLCGPDGELPEKLRNLEPRLIEHVSNEIMDRDPNVRWDDIGEYPRRLRFTVISFLSATSTFNPGICGVLSGLSTDCISGSMVQCLIELILAHIDTPFLVYLSNWTILTYCSSQLHGLEGKATVSKQLKTTIKYGMSIFFKCWLLILFWGMITRPCYNMYKLKNLS